MNTTIGDAQQDGRDEVSSDQVRLIKRYANRKLYDTRDSRYVTLQQIADFVREGEDVRIMDNTSKEDLTKVTLAQIIYEEEKKGADAKRSVASIQTLRQLVQESGERLMTTLREGPVGKLMRTRDEDGADGAFAESEDTNRFRSLISSPREAWDELQRLADDRVRGLLGHSLAHAQQLQSELRRLQARIDELESRLVSLGRRGSRPPESADEGDRSSSES